MSDSDFIKELLKHQFPKRKGGEVVFFFSTEEWKDFCGKFDIRKGEKVMGFKEQMTLEIVGKIGRTPDVNGDCRECHYLGADLQDETFCCDENARPISELSICPVDLSFCLNLVEKLFELRSTEGFRLAIVRSEEADLTKFPSTKTDPDKSVNLTQEQYILRLSTAWKAAQLDLIANGYVKEIKEE